MTAESSPRLKSPDSFGETAAPACDSTRAGAARMRWAVALLVLGLVVAIVPSVVSGVRFVRAVIVWSIPATSGQWRGRWRDVCDEHGFHPFGPFPEGTSAIDLIRSDTAWAVVAAALALVPLLFGWWRRADVGFARTAGITCAVAASASVVALVASIPDQSHLPVGVWWTVPLGGALMAAAFVVAPAPRRRDE